MAISDMICVYVHIFSKMFPFLTLHRCTIRKSKKRQGMTWNLYQGATGLSPNKSRAMPRRRSTQIRWTPVGKEPTKGAFCWRLSKAVTRPSIWILECEPIKVNFLSYLLRTTTCTILNWLTWTQNAHPAKHQQFLFVPSSIAVRLWGPTGHTQS